MPFCRLVVLLRNQLGTEVFKPNERPFFTIDRIAKYLYKP